MSGAKFIAETLKGYGVTHVFWVETIMRRTLLEMEAIGIRRVLTHSEKAAAYMADGYARVSGRPSVCMAQSVGAANLASGLQDAFLGGSPVIAFTGFKPPLAQYRHAYQEILHQGMFDPVTKWNVRVDTIEQLPYLLRQAFREATTGAPGPVHLDLLGFAGELIEAAEADLEVIVEEPFTHYPAFRPEPDAKRTEEAARLLEAAEKPVIVAGGGAVISSAGPEIVSLAERLSIPVATSLNGKGVILDSHPLSLGVVGSYSQGGPNRLVSEADLVLFIGSHTGDQTTHGWTVPPPGTPVIQIDIEPTELGRSYPNRVPLLGDAKLTVRRLGEAARPNPQGSRSGWADHAREIVQEWRAKGEPLRHSDAMPISPERLCRELTEVLPAEAILLADTGFAAVWAGTRVSLLRPGQRFIRCAGSLGWAFPAALGAKCAAPDRPVICFIGDGGFWYHLSELETASRCGIKAVTVVNNNSGFGQCWALIKAAYGDRPGRWEEMTRFQEVSFARIAEEMGCLGIRVERPGEIRSALERALQADRPAVVDVITDPQADPAPPWAPRW
jgi:acetolactate synthase-1/2/3 large subunit